MRQVDKAVAVVVRSDGPVPEVLVFDHPLAGTQLVKGTVEAGEDHRDAVRRELEEESGLVVEHVDELVGHWSRVVGAGPREDGATERHRWHVFALNAPAGTDDSWHHVARGSPEESGLTFSFRWVPIAESLADELHPLFGPVARMIVDHFR